MGICTDTARRDKPSCSTAADGGYRITTTIDPKMQAAAEDAARAAEQGLAS